MSTANLEKWHKHLKGELEGGLDALLADDCTFYSPIVFTPQEGKDLTKLTLIELDLLLMLDTPLVFQLQLKVQLVQVLVQVLDRSSQALAFELPLLAELGGISISLGNAVYKGVQLACGLAFATGLGKELGER